MLEEWTQLWGRWNPWSYMLLHDTTCCSIILHDPTCCSMILYPVYNHEVMPGPAILGLGGKVTPCFIIKHICQRHGEEQHRGGVALLISIQNTVVKSIELQGKSCGTGLPPHNMRYMRICIFGGGQPVPHLLPQSSIDWTTDWFRAKYWCYNRLFAPCFIMKRIF